MTIQELKEQQRVRKFRKVKEVVGEIALSLAVAIVCVSSLGVFLVLWGIVFGS